MQLFCLVVRPLPRRLAGVFLLLIAVGFGAILERHLRRMSLADEGELTDRMFMVPNYRHVWFHHDPAYVNGGKWNDHLCGLGLQLQRHQSDWAAWCWRDDDSDNFTNGQELGDPCCLWAADGAASGSSFSLKKSLEYRRWDLSHPNKIDFEPRDRTQREPPRCDSAYDEELYAKQFRSFYFRRADGPHEPVAIIPAKIAGALVLIAVVGYWFWRCQLLADIFPWFFKDAALSPRASCAVFLASYVYMDLTSGIVHLILDYAPHWLPVLGSLARGFQYHHHDPTAIIRISWYAYVSHIHLLSPLVTLLLILSKASRVQRLFWFWGNVNTHIFQTTHRWAHFPPEVLPLWIKALQSSGLFLTHERHMSHHEDLESQFTILSGHTDLILDTAVRVVPPWRYDLWMLLGVFWFLSPIFLDVVFRDYFDSFDLFSRRRKVALSKDETA